jgi:hypothetical protein
LLAAKARGRLRLRLGLGSQCHLFRSGRSTIGSRRLRRTTCKPVLEPHWAFNM